MRVLASFDVAHPDLTLTEIAARAQLPLSTARRVVTELEAGGFVDKMLDKHFRVGLRLWEIGSLAPRQHGLRDAALPSMHDLFEVTQESVQLAVLDGHEALCVERISGAASPTAPAVGERLPLHASAVGKCVLAFSSADVFRTVVERGLDACTRHTMIDGARLLASLRESRRTGLAYSREELTVGAVSAAAPIVAPGGLLLGALGVVVGARTDLARIVPALRTAALGIGRVCG
jgi:DNA-binding IclR family transcriptional regulator